MIVALRELFHSALLNTYEDPREHSRQEYYQQYCQRDQGKSRKRAFEQEIQSLVVEQERKAEAEEQYRQAVKEAAEGFVCRDSLHLCALLGTVKCLPSLCIREFARYLSGLAVYYVLVPDAVIFKSQEPDGQQRILYRLVAVSRPACLVIRRELVVAQI